LQGVTSIQVFAIPTSGRDRAPSSSPTARSMARAGARAGPSVIARERCPGSKVMGSCGRGPWKREGRPCGRPFYLTARTTRER
jgi:hypothetical protein